MVVFSPSNEQQKQVYNLQINNVGVVYNEQKECLATVHMFTGTW